jgi:uncharacterized tellurite resistance protein B-like protein
MKHLNLINTLSRHQHAEIIRWYRSSLALLAVLLVACGVVEYQNWQKYTKINAEKLMIQSKTTSFNSIMERKQKLKKEESDLQSKLSVLDAYQAKNNASIDFLSKLNKIANFQLASVSLNKKSITISGYCATTQEATRVIQTISSMPAIKQVKLSSLSPKTISQKSLLQLTLRGVLKLDLHI